MELIRSIQNRIYEIRGQRVMLDYDLAQLYETETKVLNQAVKRNIKRFPEDFMFRLTAAEWQAIRPQIMDFQPGMSMRSQIVTTSQASRRKDSTPYAFTEQGVAMLSSVLHSDKAINMNIDITRAFVELRRVLLSHADIMAQLQAIREHLSSHDVKLSSIYDTIENLLDEKAAQRKWADRERIGFKK